MNVLVAEFGANEAWRVTFHFPIYLKQSRLGHSSNLAADRCVRCKRYCCANIPSWELDPKTGAQRHLQTRVSLSSKQSNLFRTCEFPSFLIFPVCLCTIPTRHSEGELAHADSNNQFHSEVLAWNLCAHMSWMVWCAPTVILISQCAVESSNVTNDAGGYDASCE